MSAVEAQIRRRQKLRTQERSKQQTEQLEKLKRQLIELEATLEKEAEADEATLRAEYERRKVEAQTRSEVQRRERERQRQEEEKVRREREEAFNRRKQEMEQRQRDCTSLHPPFYCVRFKAPTHSLVLLTVEETLWRKQEERLQSDQSRLETIQRMIDNPDSVTVASPSALEQELKRKTEEVRQREERLKEYEARLEQMAAKLQRLPDVDALLRAIEGMKFGLGPAAACTGNATRKTADVFKAEIAELHKVIMEGAEVHGEQTISDTNIKLEVRRITYHLPD